MNEDNSPNILKAFRGYKKVAFGIDVDVGFWKAFLKASIREFKSKSDIPEELYSAIFPVYNLEASSNAGQLQTDEQGRSITASRLEEHGDDFFRWVTNLSLLKYYNALEIFLLQAIQLRFYAEFGDPMEGKKNADQINSQIKLYLKGHGINTDTKNNRHIIEFLKHRSIQIGEFLSQSVRVDLTTDWSHFFELISILRNVIAHQGTIINPDTLNQIKSNAKDVFERHFSVPKDENLYMNLYPVGEQFSNFTQFFNDFVLNIVKLMFDEEDFSMFNMN